MSRASVELWAKAEPFSYGAIPVAPHPRLTFTNIRKIVIYARNKGAAGFPKLSYGVWKHIACNKLHITEDLAWMFFSSCHILTDTFSPVERVRFDARIKKCHTENQKDDLRCTLKIDLYLFVLYLYIQQLYKVSLRASLVAGDEWPSQSSTLDFEGGKGTPRRTKSLDDHSHQTFIQNNLQEIIELVSEHEKGASERFDGILLLEAVDALGFILAGSNDKNRSVKTILELATLASFQSATGYSKLGQTFSLRLLQSWIKDNLGQNPFNVPSCIATGTRLSWLFAGESSRSDRSKRGKIATNANIVPKNVITGNKLIVMSQISKQTIARSSGTLELSCVKIHRSYYSYLYLLSPLRSVTVEKCRKSTIVLGPVETTLHVSNCENITIIALCRNIIISGCTLCTIYLLTPNRPALLSGNDTIILAPYHTFYPKLDEHLARMGIGTDLNLWDQPLCVGPDNREDCPVWELMPIKEFYTFTIPI
ncbi:TBCC domain-containing protein 1 [Patella vulgata]|uniref:TBCC domain-containing protein 1 n=1 Tax=Patella vulgata TaxID=6465 RepID=UPI00217FFBA1|nr:TBCC domain-containing protein 1 [Patella vulgata]